MDDKIGIAKRCLKTGEEVVTVCIGVTPPRVESDAIKFLPYGKKKLLNCLFYPLLNIYRTLKDDFQGDILIKELGDKPINVGEDVILRGKSNEDS